ncbi:MAG: helix-turn-helix transcriptional regulator [Dehalococcoidales bacterium]|nr:helix-turn-helix transcriptional regulator [Dehalococcoidales bacterium]
MSQSYLARMVGVAEPNLSQIERGQRAPWPKLKREIAQVLKISQEEIFPEVPNE